MANKYHFIGVNGIGMSALATVLVKQGHDVSGSDHSPNVNIKQFEALGIKIFNKHHSDNVPKDAVVVISSAIKESNDEYKSAKLKGCKIMTRGDLLSTIASNFETCIAIAGTHGKTTITSLITTIFKVANKEPSYFVGGHLLSEDDHIQVHSGGGTFITEVDESDGSFLKIKANQAVISNIEQDHLDYYRTKQLLIDAFDTFMTSVTLSEKGICAINLDDPISKKIIKKGLDDAKFITFSIESKDAKIRAENIQYTWSGINFSLIINGNVVSDIKLSLFGTHNVYNALAAIAIAMVNDIPLKYIVNGLESCRGVSRRLELKYKANNIVLYDDYAHHPTEIITTLEGIYKSFSNHRIIAIFQPHRYSRLTSLFNEFGGAFGRASKVFVAPVFSAGEGPAGYKNSIDLANEINQNNIEAQYCDSFEIISDEIRLDIKEGDIIIIIGAGDISLISKQIITIIKGV